MNLWGQSIGALKSHPLFGVGFGRLPDYIGLTAHNSIMVCAAELGMSGLFFWTLFLFPTLRDAIALASPDQVAEGGLVTSSEEPFFETLKTKEDIDKEEINRLGQLIVLSFTGFLVTSFFLSRAFVMTFFLLGGIAEVFYQMALQRGMVSPRLKLGRLCVYSSVGSVLLVVGVYVFIRITL